MRAIRPLSLVLGLAGCLLLVGCEQSQPMTDLGPQLDEHGMPRSVALDSSQLTILKKLRPGAEGPSWYHSRNDRTLAATAGYDLAGSDVSSTLTRDRQYTSGGRVRDNFSETTYRSEYRQSIR